MSDFKLSFLENCENFKTKLKISSIILKSDVALHLQKQPPEVFCKKKVLLQTSQNSQGSTCARASFLIKLQEISCEFCEISKNTIFTEYLWETASASIVVNFFIIFWNFSQKHEVYENMPILKLLIWRKQVDWEKSIQYTIFRNSHPEVVCKKDVF